MSLPTGARLSPRPGFLRSHPWRRANPSCEVFEVVASRRGAISQTVMPQPRKYPPGSDAEVIAALRQCLKELRLRPESLDERAGLMTGSVASFVAGFAEPPAPALRRLCEVLMIPRWLFHLLGTVVSGGDVGNNDLKRLLEERARRLAGECAPTDVDLAVEAVEIVYALGEDAGLKRSLPSSSGLADGARRLSRRAARLGEHGSSVLLEAVATIVLHGVENLPEDGLRAIADLVDLAKSLEGREGGMDTEKVELPGLRDYEAREKLETFANFEGALERQMEALFAMLATVQEAYKAARDRLIKVYGGTTEEEP